MKGEAVMLDDGYIPDPDALFDEVPLIDEDDLRWGMAIPQRWVVNTNRYYMTPAQRDLHYRMCDRRDQKKAAALSK